MTFPEFSAALDRYGADLFRWPDALRAEAARFVATDEAAARQLAEAERLEGLLARIVEPMPIGAALVGRIVAGAGEGDRKPSLPFRPTRRFASWAAAAIVALLATGFIAGVVVPADRSEEALAALIFGGGPPGSAGGLL